MTRAQDISTYLQEKPKEKTIFNVKLESFDPASKPKVIKEVKAMVPNLTLIEVRSTPVTPVSSRKSHTSYSSSRRRSLLSRYQRFSRRTYQRRTPRSSRRSLRVSVLSSPWTKQGAAFCLFHTPPLPFKTPTYHPTVNARIMSLKFLEAIQKGTRPKLTVPENNG